MTLTTLAAQDAPDGGLAGGGAPPARPPVDIRITVPLPLPGRRLFLAVLAGPERRSRERLRQERARHPLTTLGNLLFVMSGGALGALALVATALILGAVLE